MQDIVILHANNIFPQNIKDDFKAYKHLHGIEMQIHSIPKPPKQKAHDMGVKLLPLPQPQLRARTYAQTNPSAQRATQLRSVLARVYSVSRQNLNSTTVP
jgi:hypothetical protein